jgi:mycoredoxin
MLTIYSTTWCGRCRRLKAQFDREGVGYHEIDIERDEVAADFVSGLNGGNRTVPTVTFPDGTALTDPTFAEVQARLAASA